MLSLSDHAMGAHPSVLGEQAANAFRELPREVRRDRVSYLDVLLRAPPFEKVVVGERLQPSSLTDSQTATLRRVRMDEVVSVLGDVTGDRA